MPCRALLVILLGPCGCNSRGTVFTRPDLRLPFSVNVVGPSASIFFQGGDSGFDFRCALGGVESRVLRRLAGLPSLLASSF